MHSHVVRFEPLASRNESGQDTTPRKGSPCCVRRILNYLNYAPLNAHRYYSNIPYRAVGTNCAELTLPSRAAEGATAIW